VIQMYGGVGSYYEGELENAYYKIAKEKPSPLSTEYDKDYFDRLVSSPEIQRLSIKGMLATEQRIPGLGNGVLQDILFKANIHPKKKLETLTKQDKILLFSSVKEILAAMADSGGRDTEIDLFGKPGGYRTVLSKYTVGKPCPVCGAAILKEAYMGGSIYYCENCQKK
jgi:formamidopyrimidine-DNA glycosylase